MLTPFLELSMTVKNSRNPIFWLLTLLYFAQGAIASYQLNFFKPHLYAEDVPTAQIAALGSLVLLPFVIKVLFGMLCDRINLFGLGHRIPYMIVGVVLCALAFFVVYFVDPSQNFKIFAAIILAAAFAMALFDTAADAYAVEIIASDQYVAAQSYMTAGRAAGFTILSVTFGLMEKNVGYSGIFLLISMCLLVPLVLLLKMPERVVDTKREEFEWRAFAILIKPRNVMIGGLLVLVWFLFQGIDGTVTFYLSKKLLASNSIIADYGAIKGVGMVVGASLVLILSKRSSLRVAVVCTLILVTVSGLAASIVDNLAFSPLLAALLGVTAGFHWTVWGCVIMRFADLRIAGSTIAVFQIMANVGIAAGEGIATTLTSSLGFTNVFFYFAILNFLIIPPMIFCLKK